MKKIIVISIAFIFCFACAFANEQEQDKSASKKSRHRDWKRYEKYVYYPLKYSSYGIDSGSVEFKMSLFTNKEDMPRVYNCRMEFARWSAIASLSSMTLTIGDTLRYVMEKDTFHIYNLITGTHNIGSFKTALDFFDKNQFISFYAWWYTLCGKVANTSVIKNKEFISAQFEILPADEKRYCITGAGYYHIVYDAKSKLLQKYSYQPIGKWKEEFGFEKMECELIRYDSDTTQNPLLSKKTRNDCLYMTIAAQTLYYKRGWLSYENMINNCNQMIDMFGHRCKLKNDKRCPFLQQSTPADLQTAP